MSPRISSLTAARTGARRVTLTTTTSLPPMTHRDTLEENVALRAEIAEERETYNTLVALLRQRFPQRPDGSLPDWKIEDVLRENTAIRAEVERLTKERDEAREKLDRAMHVISESVTSAKIIFSENRKDGPYSISRECAFIEQRAAAIARASQPRTAGEQPCPSAQWCEKCGGMWGNHSTEQHDTLSGAVAQEKPREWPCEHIEKTGLGNWRYKHKGRINDWVQKCDNFCPICGAVRTTPADSGKESR
jgi:hypothetical protein